jgi:hypothetical protein
MDGVRLQIVRKFRGDALDNRIYARMKFSLCVLMSWHRAPESFQHLAQFQCRLIQSVLESRLTWVRLTFLLFLPKQLLIIPLRARRQRTVGQDLPQHLNRVTAG